MYSKGYQAADKDHQSAYATHQAAEEIYNECVSEETVEDALGCYKDAYNTDREQERAEENLDAQRQMANWAEGMLWATAFIGTVTAAVTALGVMYVAKTLGATSETLEAARTTNQIMRDEQRPWMQSVALTDQFVVRQNDGNLALVFSFKNVGQSPAQILAKDAGFLHPQFDRRTISAENIKATFRNWSTERDLYNPSVFTVPNQVSSHSAVCVAPIPRENVDQIALIAYSVVVYRLLSGAEKMEGTVWVFGIKKNSGTFQDRLADISEIEIEQTLVMVKYVK